MRRHDPRIQFIASGGPSRIISYLILGERYTIRLHPATWWGSWERTPAWHFDHELAFQQAVNGTLGCLYSGCDPVPPEVLEVYLESKENDRVDYELKRERQLNADPTLADVWTPWEDQPIVTAHWDTDTKGWLLSAPRREPFATQYAALLANASTAPRETQIREKVA